MLFQAAGQMKRKQKQNEKNLENEPVGPIDCLCPHIAIRELLVHKRHIEMHYSMFMRMPFVHAHVSLVVPCRPFNSSNECVSFI